MTSDADAEKIQDILRSAANSPTSAEDTPQEPHRGLKLPSGDDTDTSPPEGTRSTWGTAVVMTALCMAVFLAALDITIVSTALPTISEHFNSTTGFIWVGSAFLLSAAVVAPSWGKFSDIWGRRLMLLIATAIFFLGSVLCGSAINLPMLIVGRSIQGAAGGGLLSLVSIVVGDLFSQRDRGKYYGMVGMVWATAFTLGPLVGGAFTSHVSWRWCFYINLPISAITFFVLLFMLKLESPKTPLLAGIKAVDWIGSLALIGGLLMLLLGLELGGTAFPWRSAMVICLILFGIFTLVMFVTFENFVARNPIIPVHLYMNRPNIAVIFSNLFHGIVLTQNTYFLPLYCQSVLGFEPFLSGVLLLPFAMSMSIATVSAGVYIKKTGQYLNCIRLGFALLAIGVGLLYDLPSARNWSKIIIYQVISGFGIGLNFQPPLIALQSNISPQDNAAATASFGLVRNVASAIGIVLGSVALANSMDKEEARLASALGAETASLFSGKNAQANVLRIGVLGDQQATVVRQAFWSSIRSIWLVAVGFAGAALFICFLIEKRALETAHVEVKTGLEGEQERQRIVTKYRNGNKHEQVELVGESSSSQV